MKPVFVVVEGLDGVGKSSVSRGLAERLRESGMPAIAIRCPAGDYSLAEPYIRVECDTDARYLFYLSGARHTSDLIGKLLASQSVICDRYIYSTLAYHRAAGVSVAVDVASLRLREPDYSFYLRVSDEAERQARIRARQENTPGDAVVRHPGGLIERIEAEFNKFGLEEVDTTNRTLEEVIGLLAQTVLGR